MNRLTHLPRALTRPLTCLCLGLGLILGTLSGASVQAQAISRTDYATVALRAESDQPAAGQNLGLLLVITPKEGWHSYWENPGGAGQPVQALWDVPQGAQVSALRYPAPKTLSVAGIVNHVVDSPALLLADVQLPQTLRKGDALAIALRAQFLVCDDKLCVPQSAQLQLNLRVGDGRVSADNAPIFAKARAALPTAPAWSAQFTQVGKEIRLRVRGMPAQEISAAHFFTRDPARMDPDAPQRFVQQDGELRLAFGAQNAADPSPLEGVLRVKTAQGGPAQSFVITAQNGAVPPVDVATTSTNATAIITALVLAILGGVLLNLMPCVFPILGLKALHLAQANHDEAAARRDALAYAAGTIFICAALGALLLVLRAGGAQLGWAFQLQSPLVIALLLLLMVAIALNLSGAYALRLSFSAGQSLTEKSGAHGAFWTGALAAFVATPCTGPFMGLALGAALVLPWAAALAVFAGLGLGLALPFLAIGFIPALRQRLPKAGAWMEKFRRLMSIPMWLTAAALLWVLARQAGQTALVLGLGGALLFALLLYQLGQNQKKGKAVRGLLLRLLAVAFALPFSLAQLPPAAAPRDASAAPTLLNAAPFSPERLAALRAANKPVFLYFTADWCITCKVNEQGALADKQVANAFGKAGITTLVGDWTRGDPVISRFLAQHGRAGVPLYLYYAPDGQIRTLPQLLTRAELLALAEPAAASRE